MPFIELMHTYFRGEKLEAFGFILPIGILLLVYGIVILKIERSGLTFGVAIPIILFGLVLVSTGLGVGLRTPGQVADLTQRYEDSLAQLIQTELPRIQKVNVNFRRTYWASGILAFIGLIFVYLVKTDWAHGLGAALILIGALGLIVDGFAERRAAQYTEALRELAEQHQTDR